MHHICIYRLMLLTYAFGGTTSVYQTGTFFLLNKYICFSMFPRDFRHFSCHLNTQPYLDKIPNMSYRLFCPHQTVNPGRHSKKSVNVWTYKQINTFWIIENVKKAQSWFIFFSSVFFFNQCGEGSFSHPHRRCQTGHTQTVQVQADVPISTLRLTSQKSFIRASRKVITHFLQLSLTSTKREDIVYHVFIGLYKFPVFFLI